MGRLVDLLGPKLPYMRVLLKEQTSIQQIVREAYRSQFRSSLELSRARMVRIHRGL